jgi:hypothetical protein
MATTKKGGTTKKPKKIKLVLHKLPGKGRIDPKAIWEAVIKVRDERLAREREQAASATAG